MIWQLEITKRGPRLFWRRLACGLFRHRWLRFLGHPPFCGRCGEGLRLWAKGLFVAKFLPLILASLLTAGCAVAVPLVTAAVGVVDRYLLGKKIERLEQKVEEGQKKAPPSEEQTEWSP